MKSGVPFIISLAATLLWCLFFIGGNNHSYMTTNGEFILNAAGLFIAPAIFMEILIGEVFGDGIGWVLLILCWIFGVCVYHWGIFRYCSLVKLIRC